MKTVEFATQIQIWDKYVPELGYFKLNAVEVGGLAVAGSAWQMDANVQQTVTAWSLYNAELPDEKATRIAEFFEQVIAVPSIRREPYECMLFAAYVADMLPAEGSDCYQFQWGERREAVDPKATEPGELYVFVDERKVGLHAVTGLDKPGESLSVLGDKSPFVIASNADLMANYHASELLHVQK